MHFQISWYTFLRVKNDFKAMKLLKQFENNIEQKLLNIILEPYWKDTSLISARFMSLYEEEEEIEGAVFDVIQRINELGYYWSISKPRNISKDKDEIIWAFEGICNEPRITGIERIQFVLETNTFKEYGGGH